MNKILCTLLASTILGTGLQAENKSFNYSSIGMGIGHMFIPVPTVHVGHRERYDNDAIDTSIGIATVFIATSVSGNCSYIKYLNEQQSYIGTGFKVHAIITPDDISAHIVPTFSIGKETDKNFSEVKLSLLTFGGYGVDLAPYVTYQYGFKF